MLMATVSQSSTEPSYTQLVWKVISALGFYKVFLAVLLNLAPGAVPVAPFTGLGPHL